MKLSQSTLFFIILAVALLATLGMNIKEGLTPDSFTGTREKARALARQRSVAGVNLGSDHISSIESGVTGKDNETEKRRERFCEQIRDFSFFGGPYFSILP